ncbi:MAG: SDR family oxidoreductase [Burkholderiales bacterium]
MDLGIRGRSAIVMGGSRGLGKACAMALASEGVAVTIGARTASTVDATVAEIRAAGGQASGVAVDLRTPEGRAKLVAACPSPDILVTNCQGPVPRPFHEIEREHWVAALDDIFFAPLEMVRAVYDGMLARQFGRVISISSRSVKNPQIDLPLSNGSRAALHGFLAGISRQGIARNVTINTVSPGVFDTDAQRRHVEGLVKETGRPFDEIWRSRAASSPANRFGRAEELGNYVAFLCSAHAGYITGQTLLVDGGNYPGTL